MDRLLSIALFIGFGLGFVVLNLLIGRLVRPNLPNPDKCDIYECGETTIGSSWVQFDLRFYIVALFYLVFDVEVALLYPWAVVYQEFPLEALVLGAPFVAIVVIGYAYEWRCGSLDWVRGTMPTSFKGTAGLDLSKLARQDPQGLDEGHRA